MRKIFLSWVMVAGVAGASQAMGAAAPAAGTGATKVKLQMTPLPAPEAVLGQTEGPNAMASQGFIMPKKTISAMEGTPSEMLVAGNMIPLLVENGRAALKTPQGVIPLQREDFRGRMGFRSVALKLKNRNYLVAFPQGFVAEQRCTFNYRCGFVMKGMLGGQALMLYDEDMDGTYTAGDSMRVGLPNSPACVFAPLTKHVATPTGVYRLEGLSEDGSEVTCVRYTEPTSRVSFSFGGTGELQAAFTSREADLSFVATATAAAAAPNRAGNELMVIPGNYELLYGVVVSPQTGAIVATVGPGTSKPIEVAAMEEVKDAKDVKGPKKPAPSQKIAFGGPLKLDFRYTIANGMLKIDLYSFRTTGAGGEEYRGCRYTSAVLGISINGKTTPIATFDSHFGGYISPYQGRIPTVPGNANEDVKLVVMVTAEGMGQYKGEVPFQP